MENSSLLKSQHVNRYDYGMERQSNKRDDRKKTMENERVTDEMIDRAFVFDEMGEC